MAVDMEELQEFLGRFVADLGATFAAGNVVTGHHLGLYRALAAGPARAAELAERTSTNPRYIAEWLRGQAAGGYVEYDPVTDTYSMTEEQAFALANPDGGVYIPGAFVLALGTLKAEPRITEAFRTGAGMGWHEHDQDVFTGCEQFFRPGYIANLIPSWIPALDGVADKLQAGGKVADIGCGLGASTILLAQQYPNTRFTGSDYHDQSIEIARKRAADAGVADRISFEVASAADFSGTGMGWHEHDPDVFTGCEQFFRPGYIANLIPSWIPALDGVEQKLRAGARVADIGCGLGASTILLAQAYPNSAFTRVGLPRAVDRAGPQAGRRRGGRRPGDLRGRPGLVLLRDGLRPGRHVRLPARHGRPAGGRPAHPAGPQAGRYLAGGRALRCR